MKLRIFFEKWHVGSKHFALRDFLPTNARLLLFNALIMSHLHYSAVLLNGIIENLLTTLEKQLNWGIKACFYRNMIVLLTFNLYMTSCQFVIFSTLEHRYISGNLKQSNTCFLRGNETIHYSSHKT